MYVKFVKRTIDFGSAIFLLMLLSPIFVLVAMILTISNRGNPFFLQVRPGKDERLFRIIKFRTMNNRKDKHGNLLPDEIRLTSLGKIIRKSSLDEVPQLINVIKGDMSLIGPRPLLPQYLPLYNEIQKRRHNVRPGITGWAQVNGRNALSWEQKFKYDVWYVDNLSYELDFRIIILTLGKVLKSEGISSSTSATMEGFNGKN